jgi:hypothetical protein
MKKSFYFIRLLFLIFLVCACENRTNTEADDVFVWAKEPGDEGEQRDKIEWDGTQEDRAEYIMDNGQDPCDKFPKYEACKWKLISGH